MCAMALNHARISRLVFSVESLDGWGGCNDSVKIFHDDNLNHRYKVWRGFEKENTLARWAGFKG
jgi:tRNA(Arg) A34 adenosine deaminase TadA